MKVENFLFVLVFNVVWAVEYQSVLQIISTGESPCNNDKLFGNFDLSSVSQFGALCNVPSPDFNQTTFLLENNVVPILCMGLYDVSQRICKAAEDDISRFNDIFPPETDKFNKIFDKLENSQEYSSLGQFCSKTVKTYAIDKAASNFSKQWWEVLNQQFKYERNCTNLCHTNDRNKVHPLCSYIVWSIGVFQNFEKNQAEAKATEDGQFSTLKENVEEIGKIDNVPNILFQSNNNTNKESSAPQTQPEVALNLVTSEDNKILPPGSVLEKSLLHQDSNVTSGNNFLEIGDDKQGSTNNEDQNIVSTVVTKTHTNAPLKELKSVEKGEKPKDKDHSKNKLPRITLKPGESTNIENISHVPIAHNITNNTIESKIDFKNNKTVFYTKPGGLIDNAGSKNSPTSGIQKIVDQTKTKIPDSGFQPKPADAMVEGDFSLEVTSDGAALDQPITADKDFQPPYSDEEGEDGDGDDIDIIESNGSAYSGTNKTLVGITDSRKPGISNIDRGALEGDKVYEGDGVIIEDHFIEAEDSHFFTYFLCMAVLTVMAYLAFHNKKKLIALAVEGRRSKGGRRRPNSSHYSKLDCSLEEALVSNTTASVTHVLY